MTVRRGLVANARFSFPSYERIVESRARAIRTIVYSNDDLEAALQNVPPNVDVIALLNSEHEHVGQSYLGWEVALPRFAQQFAGRVKRVEITNEADLLGLPASLVARLVKFSTPILHDNGIMSAIGGVAGPDWQGYLEELAQLLTPDDFDEGGLHPYGQKIAALGSPQPGFMPGLFFAVQRASHLLHDKKILVSEFGAKLRDYGGPERQAEYVLASYNELDALPPHVCDCACYFAWRDDVGAPHEQGPDAFGLIDADDQPRQAWDQYKIVAAAYTPQPEPTVTVKAIDVSSHQPANLTSIIHQHQPKHVIVKLYMPWESISFNHTAQQVASAKDNGCSVGGYVWAYRSQDPIATIDAVIDRCASIGLVLPLLWIDCETYEQNGVVVDPGPDAEWLARAVDHAERVYGMKCGIYTGLWWIRGHFPGGEAEFSNFSRLPIWLSQYDNSPAITNIDLPLGWNEAAAKQYTATPIDQNSIRPEYTVYEGGSQPPPDPCEHFTQQLDAWINAKPFKSPSKKKLVALRGGQ